MLRHTKNLESLSLVRAKLFTSTSAILDQLEHLTSLDCDISSMLFFKGASKIGKISLICCCHEYQVCQIIVMFKMKNIRITSM